MKNVSYGMTNYDELTVVHSHILIEKISNYETKAGDIIIPESEKYANNKLGCGKILEIGTVAANETSLKAGDFVLYDYYSANGVHGEHVIVKYDSIILQLTEEEANSYLNSNLL
jgi:co-chaperonin GroES (HSP10)